MAQGIHNPAVILESRVLVDQFLNFRLQTSAAVARAKKLFGIVNKSFVNLSKKSLPLLLNMLIRPHIEFVKCIWGFQSRGVQ